MAPSVWPLKTRT